MKYQMHYANKTWKFFLYGLCLFLIFLLGLAYSSIVMAQVYDLGISQNFFNPDWVFVNDMYSWGNNFNTPSTPVYPGDLGRMGFQSQAPAGIQVLSARNMHMLYSFWTRPYESGSDQDYYSVYPNPYQPSPNPPMPFYQTPYWHSTSYGAMEKPSMFYAEPHWLQTGMGGMGSSSGIGPSMFSGKAYWAPMGGNLMISGPN